MNHEESKECIGRALAGVVQLVGRHPAGGKVAGSIAGHGTCLGCGFGPHLWHVREATN